jgi:hypothetical protein
MKRLINFWYSTMEGKYLSRMGHFTTVFMISTIAGILKELMDKYSGRGQVSFVAFLLTSLGGLLAYVILGI